MAPDPICLYAVVPTNEANLLRAATRDVRLVSHGPITAVVDRVRNATQQRSALRHARIVGGAVETCSSVVPFRVGVQMQSEAELREVLRLNLRVLSGCLARFHERVEMGLKARLEARAAGGPMRVPSGIDRARALAPSNDDRREHLRRWSSEQVFEGCYLISRQAVDAFWSAVEHIRGSSPDLRLIGSGPWAAYSFCDLELRASRPSEV